VVTKAGLSVYF